MPQCTLRGDINHRRVTIAFQARLEGRQHQTVWPRKKKHKVVKELIVNLAPNDISVNEFFQKN